MMPQASPANGVPQLIAQASGHKVCQKDWAEKAGIGQHRPNALRVDTANLGLRTTGDPGMEGMACHLIRDGFCDSRSGGQMQDKGLSCHDKDRKSPRQSHQTIKPSDWLTHNDQTPAGEREHPQNIHAFCESNVWGYTTFWGKVPLFHLQPSADTKDLIDLIADPWPLTVSTLQWNTSKQLAVVGFHPSVHLGHRVI